MNIQINGENRPFSGATLAEWLKDNPPQAPFAVSVNTIFIPKARYAETVLNEGDKIEIVRPVVGG